MGFSKTGKRPKQAKTTKVPYSPCMLPLANVRHFRLFRLSLSHTRI